MTIKYLALIGIIATLLGLASAVPVKAQAGVSGIRLVNASPDGLPIALRPQGQEPWLTSITRNTVSAYKAVPSGKYRLEIVLGGTRTLELSDTLKPGQHYTLAVVGKVGRAVPYLFLDNPAAPAEGLKLRLYHFSPDAPAVDLRVSEGGTVIANVAFPQASAYVASSFSGELSLWPTQVFAPELTKTRALTGSGTTWSIFVLNDLANLEVIENVDIPVVDLTRPTSLPNTGDTALNVANVVRLGLLFICIGLIICYIYGGAASTNRNR